MEQSSSGGRRFPSSARVCDVALAPASALLCRGWACPRPGFESALPYPDGRSANSRAIGDWGPCREQDEHRQARHRAGTGDVARGGGGLGAIRFRPDLARSQHGLRSRPVHPPAAGLPATDRQRGRAARGACCVPPGASAAGWVACKDGGADLLVFCDIHGTTET